MGVYDDAARFAAEADPVALMACVLSRTPRRDLVFGGWLNPRTSPVPGSPERIADLLAILHDPLTPTAPWLIGVELQSRPSEAKLRVTLETAGIFGSRARQDDGMPYRVTSALVHLTGSLGEPAIDARLGEYGTFHRPLPWDIERDEAEEALQAVEDGTASWGLLFWVALMAGAEQERIITRWMAVVASRVADVQRRSDLAGISLVFGELAGRFLVWQRLLGGWTMTESAVVNSWIEQGDNRGNLRATRRHLLELLDIKFPGAAPDEVRQLIEEQDTQSLLDDWFRALARAATYEDFLAVLRR
jgi:hypothetical protein